MRKRCFPSFPLLLSCLMFLCCLLTACQKKIPALLTSTQQIRELSIDEAGRGHTVKLRGRLAYLDNAWSVLMLQDASGGVMVDTQRISIESKNVSSELEITGRTGSDGNSPLVIAETATLISSTSIPAPSLSKVSVRELAQHEPDGREVETRGIVRDIHQTDKHVRVTLAAEGSSIQVVVENWVYREGAAATLIDAQVVVRGTWGPPGIASRASSRGVLYTQSKENLSIEDPATFLPALPTLAIRDLTREMALKPLPRKHRVSGEIIAQLPGRSLTLRDDSGELEILTTETREFTSGEKVEVFGYPAFADGKVKLEDGLVYVPGAPVGNDLSDGYALQRLEQEKNEKKLLTSVAEVHMLTPIEAIVGHPVRIEAVVTCYDPKNYIAFVQDETGGCYLAGAESQNDTLKAGQRIALEGVTIPGGFAPSIRYLRHRFLRNDALPKAIPMRFDLISSGSQDGALVEVEATIRSVQLKERLYLGLANGGAHFTAVIGGGWNRHAPTEWVGASVRVRGIWSPGFNLHRRVNTVRLYIPDAGFLQMTRASDLLDPFTLPATPVSALLTYQPGKEEARTLVRGVVTMSLGKEELYLREGRYGLKVSLMQPGDAQPGDVVEVVGFPSVSNDLLQLTDAVMRRVRTGNAPQPLHITPESLQHQETDNQLVKIQAKYLGRSHQGKDVVYLMQADALTLRVRMDERVGTGQLVEMEPGSLVSVTGLCQTRSQTPYDWSRRLKTMSDIEILLASPDSVKVIQAPPWLNVRRAFWMVAAVASLCLLIVVWMLVLRRKVRQQTRIIREKLSRELRLEKRYQELFDNASEMIFTLDAQGKFTSLNKAGEKLTGYSAPEISALTLPDLLVYPNATAESGMTVPFSLASTGGEITLRTRQGNTLPVEISLTEFAEEEAGTQILGIGHDISQRKQSEAELREFAGKLARSNQELSEFASIASHDLQEPLRKVITFSGRLKTRLGDKLDDSSRDYLERMEQTTVRMQRLIDDLLAYSRISTKAQPLEIVDLNLIAQEAIADLETRIERTGGSIELESLPIVEADPTQLRQLFQNLIGNGLKFSRTGVAPVVKISSRLLRDECGSESFWQISIADNGIGFDEKYLERIFMIFQRLHGRNEYEGTGIGLAVCRKIVERHGGVITATSQPNAGATFIFTIPCVGQGLIARTETQTQAAKA